MRKAVAGEQSYDQLFQKAQRVQEAGLDFSEALSAKAATIKDPRLRRIVAEAGERILGETGYELTQLVKMLIECERKGLK